MIGTPKKHFDADIKRAEAIVGHAKRLPHEQEAEKLLRDDILRSAWMFAVGAMDAYFCDAYISLVVRSLRAKALQPAGIDLPVFVKGIQVPVGAILAKYAVRTNWTWRMALRNKMEFDNILKLSKVQQLFNPFLRKDETLIRKVIDRWIRSPNATARVFGRSPNSYIALSSKSQRKALEDIEEKVEERFKSIIQRRHDCIHNCDRPKSRPQYVRSPGTVLNVVRDIVFLVENFNGHVDSEFSVFLDGIGCTGATKNKLGY